MKLKPIKEQVVVVCGASSGIGRKTALTFAEQGAKVVVSARNAEGLDSLVEEIRAAGGEASSIAADVTRYSDLQAVADAAADTYGRIDTWVQTAAISLYAKFEETEPDEFARVIEVNLMGTVNAARAALPHLKKTAQEDGGAALICTSSVEGKRALPLQSAYASSKHAIIGLLDALRVELQEEGVPISVTNVMPAGINTPFFNKARTKMGVKPMPMPPIYEPDVVAQVMLYAAAHPTRDISAGGAAKSFIWGQKFTPRLLDKVLVRTGFKGQMTDEPKAADAPANTYTPVSGQNHVYGDFSDQAKGSMATWFDTHPMAGRAIKGAALAAVAFAISRSMRSR